MDETILQQIIEQYPFLGTEVKLQKISSGYINDTYLLTDIRKGKSYVLQRINEKVFSDIGAIMRNIDLVTTHIQSRLENTGNKLKYHNFRFLYSKTGMNYIEIDDHSKWRICDFIDNFTPDPDNKTKIAEESGKLLAIFHSLTDDLDTDKLSETISGFHNLTGRWKDLENVVELKSDRFIQTEEVYNKIMDFKYLLEEYKINFNNENLTLKVVHNDPKSDNILFDDDGKAICLIDLDTVMPGYRPVDFGDAIRSLCNTASEDENNVSKVNFDMNMFKSFTASYLRNMQTILSKNEKSQLVPFTLFITFEQAIRFYVDYLKGDIYYRIQYPQHNLNRAKVQLILLESMVSGYEEMESFVFE